MVNGKIIAGIVLSVLILGVVYFFVSVGDVQESGNSIKVLGTGSSVMDNEKTIEIMPDGFSPSDLTITLGNTVIFENKDTEKHWLILESFGVSKELASAETYSLFFDKVGTFEYYDNLNKEFAGIIIVE